MSAADFIRKVAYNDRGCREVLLKFLSWFLVLVSLCGCLTEKSLKLLELIHAYEFIYATTNSTAFVWFFQTIKKEKQDNCFNHPSLMVISTPY